MKLTYSCNLVSYLENNSINSMCLGHTTWKAPYMTHPSTISPEHGILVLYRAQTHQTNITEQAAMKADSFTFARVSVRKDATSADIQTTGPQTLLLLHWKLEEPQHWRVHSVPLRNVGQLSRLLYLTH